MKSKLLLQNNVAIVAERYGDSVKIYFSDGHYEISDERIEDYLLKEKSKVKYKNPIDVYGQKLYPTKNRNEKDCIWINLDYLDNRDEDYIMMLKNRDVFDIAVKMFLKNKEIQLKNA